MTVASYGNLADTFGLLAQLGQRGNRFSSSHVLPNFRGRGTVKLTVNATAALKLPAGKSDHIEFDDEIPGFGLRFREGGARWVFQYKIGTQHRRITFGRYPAMKVGAAREQAAKFHAKVKLGLDPAGEKAENQARAAETFQACMDTYLEKRRREEHLRPTTLSEIERHLERNLKPLHGLRIDKIDRRVIATELARLASDAPVQANRTRASLVKFLNWCAGEGYIDANPAVFTNKNPEQARERVPTVVELAAIWKALPAGDFGDILKLLMLTGQRRDEIADLEWVEVNLDNALITLPPRRTKNHRKHTVPLSNAAKLILSAREQNRPLVFGRGQGGFSGWSQSKRRLNVRLAIPPWTIHDLRRGVSTGLGDIGVQPHVVESVLNHISGTKAGVAGVYNRAAYEEEKKIALTDWAKHLMAAIEGVRP
jgi:integrase